MNPIEPGNFKNARKSMNPINPGNSPDPKNEGDLSNKVIPIKPKEQPKQMPQRRASLPKQPHKKVIIRDAKVKRKKKKEPFSAQYVRKKTGTFWTDYWEIIVTIIIAIFLAIFILPRFLQ